jgi:hypothetical protein
MCAQARRTSRSRVHTYSAMEEPMRILKCTLALLLLQQRSRVAVH